MARPNILARQYRENVERANERIENNTVLDAGIDYNYCVLNDTGCGEVTPENLLIQKGTGRNAGYHATIGGRYEDPDNQSLMLYTLIAYKFGKGIEKYGISNFRVSVRGDKGKYCYMYCISAEYEGKTIRLAGDWAASWEVIADCPAEDRFEAATRAHTIAGHPVWPCDTVGKRNTVNQVRKADLSMKKTLDVLRSCYDSSFTEKTYNADTAPVYSNLEDAFFDYKDWYLSFGSYKEYVAFWELARFEQGAITKYNIMDVFS